MAYLEIHKGRTIVHTPLEDEANSIGRQDGNSIVINDKDVSRQHCVIEKWDGAFSIYDVGSRNGVVVNGERVQRAPLRTGDVITLGGTIAKFLDAPLKPVAKSVTKRRAWMTWVPALTMLFVTAAVVAWALGLIDGRMTWKELQSRIGLTPHATTQSTSTPAKALPSQADASSDADDTKSRLGAASPNRDRSTVSSEKHSFGDGAERRIESDDLETRYALIERGATAADLDAMLGQLVAARFIGKPIHDEHGRVTWELPPDGAVIAVIELQTDAAAAALATIDAEPTLIDAELSGRLTRDAKGDGFILRVGVVKVLHALNGNDAAMAEATREMIGKRIIINSRYAAAGPS